MNTNKKIARMAGFFYLMFIATSVLADKFASIGFGDVAAIVEKIVAYPGLSRIGFVIGLLSVWLLRILSNTLIRRVQSEYKD